MVAKVLTVHEVAAILKKGASSIRKMIRLGELPAKKIGGSVRILETDLQEFLDSPDIAIVPESPERKQARQYKPRAVDGFDRSVFLN